MQCFSAMFHLAKNKNPTRTSRNPRGNSDSALSKAAESGDLEAVKMILNKVPTVQSSKVQALFAAGLFNRFEVLKYLLTLFSDKNPPRDNQGNHRTCAKIIVAFRDNQLIF